MKKTVLKTYFYTLLVGTAYLIFVRLTNISMPCVFYELTGIQCPSCGTTTMFVELSKLNIANAISCNPMIFFLLCVWVFISLMIFIGIKPFRNKKFLFVAGIMSVLFLLAFGFHRVFL